MGALRVRTCIPWRAGQPDRERLWAVVRPHLEALGYPLVLGDSPGPWSRAAACNAAAAGQWDVAVFADADTVPDPEPVYEAVELAHEHGIGVRPHDKLWHLTKAETTLLLRYGRKVFSKRPPRRAFPGGGLMVISRVAWEAAGGYDETFVGWGHEDSAFGVALVAHAGWRRIPGEAFHLWHPRDPADTPERRANRERMRALAAEHAEAIRRASEEQGIDVGAIL